MNTLNIKTLNNKLVDMTNNIKTAKTVRANTIQTVITETLEYAKDNKDLFAKQTKKSIMTTFVNNQGFKTVSELDTHTVTALRIAKIILVDGYSVRYNLLSANQILQLSKFTKSSVKKLFTITEDDLYISEVKALIATAKIEKTTKTFSAKKAQTL